MDTPEISAASRLNFPIPFWVVSVPLAVMGSRPVRYAMGSSQPRCFCVRTASRSTVARPARRPSPTALIVGSTIPTGILSFALYLKYAFTSLSVICVVWEGAAVAVLTAGLLPKSTIRVSLALKRSASCLVRRKNAPADEVASAVMRMAMRPNLCSTIQFYRHRSPRASRLPLFRPFAPAARRRPLACADEQVELLPLDLFLEDAEARLLAGIQHLIHGFVLAPDRLGRLFVEVTQRFHAVPQGRFIGGGARRGEAAEFLNHLVAGLHVLPARVLETLQPGDELAVLIV